MKHVDDEQYDDEETAKRRDSILRVLVNTPPQPRTRNRPAQRKQKPTVAGRARKAADRQQKS
jgi:hypothetical protein